MSFVHKIMNAKCVNMYLLKLMKYSFVFQVSNDLFLHYNSGKDNNSIFGKYQIQQLLFT